MYKLVTKFADLGDFISDIQKYKVAGFDTETTGLDPFVDKVTLIQVKLGETTYLINTVKLGEKYSKYVCQIINDSKILLVGYNLKFDNKMLSTNFDELILNTYDVMLAEVIAYNGIIEDRYPSLADIVRKYYSIELDKSVRNNFIGNFSGEFTEQDYIYAADDVEYLLDIREKQLTRITEYKQERVLELESKLLPVVCSMELNGVALDKEQWLSLSDVARSAIVEVEKELRTEIVDKILSTKTFANALEAVQFLGIVSKSKMTIKLSSMLEQITDLEYIRQYIYDNLNLRSPDQMLVVLRDIYKIKDYRGLPIPNTNEKTINKFILNYPITKKIITYREHAKKVESFGEGFFAYIHPKTGRIHTNFNQLGAQSGRFSSSSINLQNIPKESEYRAPFVARPGHVIIAVDFSQEELRILSVVANVKRMIAAFNSGLDLHTVTGADLYDMVVEELQALVDAENKEAKTKRGRGKTLNFAVGYGSTEYGLYKNFDIPLEEGKELLKKFYNELYPEIDQAKAVVGKKILETGYSTTLLGRKRFFQTKILYANYKEKEREEAKILREGFNHIVQGTGAEIIKESLCRIFYENPFGRENLRILLQVYDEIVCEVREDLAEEAKEFIKAIMLQTEAKYLRDIVPAAVDAQVAKYWKH
jgi:DNA polymerase-1